MATVKNPADTVGALAVRDQVGKLLKAANEGNLTSFKSLATLIANGEDLAPALVGVKDGNDRGSLHFAALGGKIDICKYLVEEVKLPVDPVDSEGETPLILAARLGLASTAEYLLDHGADPDVEGAATSAIHHAAGAGSLDLMKKLLDRGVDVDSSSTSGPPLIWAAGHGKIEAVELLLARGANPNASADDEVTPLLTAAAAEYPDVVKLLVKNGADVNSAAGGVTALHVAAEQGDEETVRCLLGAKADANVADDDKTTPIQAAARSGQRNIVELLLPVTTPLSCVSEWSVDGLMSYAKNLDDQEKAVSSRHKEFDAIDKTHDKQKVSEVSPERTKAAAEAKARGTQAFKRKDYMDAIDEYTQANDLDPTNVESLSNRSLCWMRLGQAEHALVDAQALRKLAPDWPKSYYREGSALRLLQRFDEAADAFYSGVQVSPENKELVEAFKEAVVAGKKFHGVPVDELDAEVKL